MTVCTYAQPTTTREMSRLEKSGISELKHIRYSRLSSIDERGSKVNPSSVSFNDTTPN